nr:MAG TPA: hypothetical protein [Caudoviricetes sp.]
MIMATKLSDHESEIKVILRHKRIKCLKKTDMHSTNKILSMQQMEYLREKCFSILSFRILRELMES